MPVEFLGVAHGAPRPDAAASLLMCPFVLSLLLRGAGGWRGGTDLSTLLVRILADIGCKLKRHYANVWDMKRPRTEWVQEWIEQVSNNIAEEREKAGISQRQLSELVSALGRPISAQTIAKTEQCKKAVIGIDEIALYAIALGIPQAQLMYAPGKEIPIGPGRYAPARAAGRGFHEGLTAADVLRSYS